MIKKKFKIKTSFSHRTELSIVILKNKISRSRGVSGDYFLRSIFLVKRGKDYMRGKAKRA